MELNAITHEIIGSAMDVHSAFGPGMLESAYEKCLVYELAQRGFFVESQVVLPLTYKGITIDAGYRLDLRVAQAVIVEVKAIQATDLMHRAQLLVISDLPAVVSVSSSTLTCHALSMG